MSLAGGGMDTDPWISWDDPAEWEWEDLLLEPRWPEVELVGA